MWPSYQHNLNSICNIFVNFNTAACDYKFISRGRTTADADDRNRGGGQRAGGHIPGKSRNTYQYQRLSPKEQHTRHSLDTLQSEQLFHVRHLRKESRERNLRRYHRLVFARYCQILNTNVLLALIYFCS